MDFIKWIFISLIGSFLLAFIALLLFFLGNDALYDGFYSISYFAQYYWVLAGVPLFYTTPYSAHFYTPLLDFAWHVFQFL